MLKNYQNDNSFSLTKFVCINVSHHMEITMVNNFKVEKVIYNCGPYNEIKNNKLKIDTCIP